MTEITDIQQESKYKMRVSLNGEPAFCITTKDWNALGYTKGSILDAQDEEKLNQLIARLAAKTAMDLLIKRDYTTDELKKKLMMKGFNHDFALQGVSYVEHYHYLDDVRYIQNYVMRYKGRLSRQMLCYKLRQKGLDVTLINECLNQLEWDDHNSIKNEILKRYTLDQLSEFSEKERQKMIQSLLRKGYNFEEIRRILNEIVIKF